MYNPAHKYNAVSLVAAFDIVQYILLNYQSESASELAEHTGLSKDQVRSVCDRLGIVPAKIILRSKEKTFKQHGRSKINFEKLVQNNKKLADKIGVPIDGQKKVYYKRVLIEKASGEPNRTAIPFIRPSIQTTNIPSPYGIATQMLVEQNLEELQQKKGLNNE